MGHNLTIYSATDSIDLVYPKYTYLPRKCIQSTHKLEDLSWPDEGNQILSLAPHIGYIQGPERVVHWLFLHGCVLPGLDSSKSKSSQKDTDD